MRVWCFVGECWGWRVIRYAWMVCRRWQGFAEIKITIHCLTCRTSKADAAACHRAALPDDVHLVKCGRGALASSWSFFRRSVRTSGSNQPDAERGVALMLVACRFWANLPLGVVLQCCALSPDSAR